MITPQRVKSRNESRIKRAPRARARLGEAEAPRQFDLFSRCSATEVKPPPAPTPRAMTRWAVYWPSRRAPKRSEPASGATLARAAAGADANASERAVSSRAPHGPGAWRRSNSRRRNNAPRDRRCRRRRDRRRRDISPHRSCWCRHRAGRRRAAIAHGAGGGELDLHQPVIALVDHARIAAALALDHAAQQSPPAGCWRRRGGQSGCRDCRWRRARGAQMFGGSGRAPASATKIAAMTNFANHVALRFWGCPAFRWELRQLCDATGPNSARVPSQIDSCHCKGR